MEDENLIGVYLKLLSVLECPVCLDYLTKPVAMCNEGHALCSKCKLNLSTCPLCRNHISPTRGLILDQIIETLLYPCYKMGCGSLLKRSDAESHDLNCNLENAGDKQTVLHNNLLKNIEENFGSFLVKPEIVKETRTVGTVTGKVKTADARVQTAIPFSSSLLLEKLNSSTSAGCSSPLSGHPKAGLSSGISISSIEKSPNSSFKAADLSSLAFTFPQTSAFDQSALAFSVVNPGGLNNTSMFSYPQDSNIQFSLEPYQNNSCFSRDNAAFNPSSKPFMFTYGIENKSGEVSKNSSRKPSTNLNFTMGNGPSRKETEEGASNRFFVRNQDIPFSNFHPSGDSMNFNHLALSSSSSGPFRTTLSRDDFNLENKTSKTNTSTNLGSCSTSGDSLMAATQRKRPTTNLSGLTTLA